MTLKDYSRAAKVLKQNYVDLRVFILVKPPFMDEKEAPYWAERSIDFAFDCGATTAVLIPTRAGNGAMDELAHTGHFAPPRLATLERAVSYGLSCSRGKVLVDLWGLGQTGTCPNCYIPRYERLRTMNLTQSILDPVVCPFCGDSN